jgi:hypothetical protein
MAAEVVMVSVLVKAEPLLGATVAGENEQDASLGNRPQENFTVPE